MQKLMSGAEAKELIKQLENVDLKASDAEKKLYQILYSRPIVGPSILVKLNPHPDLFYVRARIYNKVDDFYKTIDCHSYNKQLKLIRRGRANFPEQPIFYAGRTRITSLAEVNVIQNQKDAEKVAYGISRWVINKPVRFVAILNPDTLLQMKAGVEDQNLVGELDQLFEEFTAFYVSIKGTQAEGILSIYKYISEKFTEKIVVGEEHKYILTSVLANQIFKATPGVAGILYQSVKWPQTYNLAIKPEFIDNGYLVPSSFFKETLIRENVTDLKEISLLEAKSFDIGQNIVEW